MSLAFTFTLINRSSAAVVEANCAILNFVLSTNETRQMSGRLDFISNEFKNGTIHSIVYFLNLTSPFPKRNSNVMDYMDLKRDTMALNDQPSLMISIVIHSFFK